MYQVKRVSRSEFIPLRNLDYHVRVWGQPVAGQPPLFLMHGFMDVGASWQFMVDALAEDRHVIAPDWRGFGLTRRQDGGTVDNYWFPDYLADLEFLFDHYAGDQPVNLVGHSMGGNVVMHYAGVRPHRIKRLINLEGFGLAASQADEAPLRYARWIDELKALHRGTKGLVAYESSAGVTRRLMRNNPRLSQDKADWLAQHWARPNAEGRWEIFGDPAHKVVSANVHRVEEVLALYRRITAPTLMVEASDNMLERWWKGNFSHAEFRERIQHVPHLSHAGVEDAGHMLHHDQPQRLAELVEDFLA
ncbi:MAG: alpha/beta hydrolase [Burkholderiaceae bacterium]|nr:alpha/beta hydrolase [Burkholderiaceae bacterium]